MTGPLIEVVMPFYGDLTLMQRAVESIRAQTDPRWRLVVVDDANDDAGAVGWIDGLRDARISCHRNPVRLGVRGNFRHCGELVEAPYAVVMGCDDLMHPTYVAAVSDALHLVAGVAALQPRVQVIDADGRACRPVGDRAKALLGPAPGLQRLGGEPLATSLSHGAWTYFPAICWRRDVVRRLGTDPRYETALDLALLIDLALAGEELVVLEGVHFSYRRHRSSASTVTARSAERFAEERDLYTDAARRFAEHGWPTAARAARWRLTSRAHALMLIPAAARRRARTSGALWQHALGA